MLRRKLILVIAPMVALLLASAITGIWLLEGTLGDMERVNQKDLLTAERANEFVNTIRDLRKDVHEMIAGHAVAAPTTNGKLEHAESLLGTLDQSSLVREPRFARTVADIRQRIPGLRAMVAALSAPPPGPGRPVLDAALNTCNDIDFYNSRLNEGVRDLARAEQSDLSKRFRFQVLMLTIIAILIVNVTILMLLRMGSMILKPVDHLVEAARQLGLEHFETRVHMESKDEFGVLADAFNHMAQELQAGEQRRMDVLGQVALALNHELNNVVNIIELQLMLVSKRCDDSGESRAHLQRIRDSLARMTGAVKSLKDARRIVLTDYMAGIKMLDLRRSMEDVDAAEHLPASCPPETESKS